MDSGKILIKQAKIVDPNSSHHLQVKDILIENDVVIEIADSIDAKDAQVVEHANLHISPGWFDLRANFCDPGHEEREDIESGIHAAIFGGFTSVAVSPETSPAIDSKAAIEYVYQRAEEFPVNVLPYGSLSKGLQGEELSEMYDMYQSGAVGFSHGKKPVANAALIKLALLYGKEFAPPIHVFSMDESLAYKGQMHEGEVSTYLGLKGIPALAEEVTLLRDLHLSEYAENAIHFMAISSESGVSLLRNAHSLGKPFTADVALANLIFTDEALDTYDSNLKVSPPIRAKKDREALIKALNEEIIQVITSDHTPVDVEYKKCEFDQADFGMITLESFFGALGNLREDGLNLEQIIKCIAINPRKVLGMETPSVEVNSWGEFTLFDPDHKWTFGKEHIQSKSRNTPFIGKELTGKPLGIINNNILVWMAEK
ncbi:dihydroorotase [Owenweeksia hongkongensis]|uniref:dihydroorotase n=1 Tax=Owenweeksia hongkongensis TaxID=253245 RepID=UPI003A8DADAB